MPVPGAASPSKIPAELRAVRLVVVLVAAAQIGFLIASAVPTDPIASVWLTPDSPDWLASGLSLAGERVTTNDRPPLLPLLYAGLYSAGLERLIPKLHELAFFLLAGSVAWLAWRATRDPTTALLAALVVQVNGTIWLLAHFVMADVTAAGLSACAAACLLAAPGRLAAGIGFGLFFLAALATQNVLPILLPAFVLFVVLARRRFGRRELGAVLAGLVFGPALIAGYHVLRARSSGGPAAFGLHLPYLGLAPGGLVSYPWAALTLFGPLLVALPLAFAGRDAERRAERELLVVWLVAGFLFFAVFYRFFAKRFVLFYAPPIAVFLAVSLHRILAWASRGGRSRRLVGYAALAALVWFGTIVPLHAFEPRLALAPGVAVAPRGLADPAHAADAGCVFGDVARPAFLRERFARSVFDDVDALLALSRRVPAAVGHGDVALVDARRQDVYVYLVSVIFRAPVAFAAPSDHEALARAAWVVARKPEAPEPGAFLRVAETGAYALFRRSAP